MKSQYETKTVTIGERKVEGRPFYASFWMLDHKDGSWSMHETRKEAYSHWRNELNRKATDLEVTWIRCAERADLVEWINIQQKADRKKYDSMVHHEKRKMLEMLAPVAFHGDGTDYDERS